MIVLGSKVVGVVAEWLYVGYVNECFPKLRLLLRLQFSCFHFLRFSNINVSEEDEIA